jgi:predicted nicotinamide N-methyase
VTERERTPTIDADAFVQDNTRLSSPPLVPELVLHVAHEVVPLWTRTEDLGSGALPPPYWAFAWPGGQALARYILDHPGEFAGRSVLDFGAGSGLVAIAAARAGAKASACDIDPFSLAAIARNSAANAVEVNAIAADLIGVKPEWDIILVGDMCYERPLADRLLPWLRQAAAGGTRVLLGDPGRSYFPGGGVEKLATYAVPTTRDLEDRDMRETSIYRLLPA